MRGKNSGGEEEGTAMPVMSVVKFERFFRIAAGLDADKADLRRHGDFVNQKLYDLLLRVQAAAKANGRDIIQPHDLPITKGLQECIHQFREIDEEIELRPILDELAARPPLDLFYSDETEARHADELHPVSLDPVLSERRPA
jgi:hypothetical protein